MQVDCPECAASLEATPGSEMVCPACMTPFVVPASERAVRLFDVQPGGESVLHELSRHAIREAIYTGRLDASARVRHGAGEWELIGGYPEFASVFRMLGGDLSPIAGTRKLAGWKRAPGAEPPRASAPSQRRTPPPVVAPAPAPERRPVRPQSPPPSTGRGPYLVLGAGVLLVIAVLVAYLR